MDESVTELIIVLIFAIVTAVAAYVGTGLYRQEP